MVCYGARPDRRSWPPRSPPRAPAPRVGIQPGDVLVADRRIADLPGDQRLADRPRDARRAECSRTTSVAAPKTSNFDLELQSPPAVVPGLYYSARARRHPCDRGRGVGPAAPPARSGDASLLLAGRRVLRRPVVHAERPLRSARLLLRVGRSGGAARPAAALPALCARVSGAPATLGSQRRSGRRLLPLVYVPAAVLGVGRALVVAGRMSVPDVSLVLERIEWAAYLYLAVCLLGGLFIMVRALTRLRSVTARRQLRWIVWGSSVGAVPFVMLYVVPLLFGRVPSYGSYTAVLLGCIPLGVRLGDRPLPADGRRGDHQERDGRGGRRLRARAHLRRHALARGPDPRGRQSEQQLLGAVRDADRGAHRAVAAWRHPGGARSSLLPRSVRLSARARGVRARAEQRPRTSIG